MAGVRFTVECRTKAPGQKSSDKNSMIFGRTKKSQTKTPEEVSLITFNKTIQLI